MKLVISNHAKVRGLERLLDIKLHGEKDWEKLQSNPEMSWRIEEFLMKQIKPSAAFSQLGVKYQARLDSYDYHRAVIEVSSESVHTVTSIVPITK